LAYIFELAPIEKNIAMQSIRLGNKLPDRILNAPELTQGLEFYLQAFLELDSERFEQLRPIPFAAMQNYSNWYDLEEEQSEDLFHIIRKVDNAELKKRSEKIEAQRNANKPRK